VIDDDPLVLEAMRGILQSWGCSVATAKSNAAMLAVLAGHHRRPDLIISDYRLGHGRTGFDVIEQLRSTFGAQIPAFLISGDTAPERLREASASGYYLLHKPVLPMTLRSVVSQLLKDHAERPTGPAAAGRKSTDQKSAAVPSPALPQQ
jgi:CheY-like chemotaxis protein